MVTFDQARRKGVPLVAVETPDQPQVWQRILASFGGEAPALFVWDAFRGMIAANESAGDAMCGLGSAESLGDMTRGSLAQVLVVLLELRTEWALVALGANRQVAGQEADRLVAALLAHRDAGKARRQIVYLIGPAPWQLPADLRGDCLIISEELPTDSERDSIIRKLAADNEYHETEIPRAVEATRGLSAFAVEQAAALSSDAVEKSFSVSSLWDQARAALAQVPGLTMAEPSELFKLEDIAGNSQVIAFYRRLFSGPEAPSAVVLLDEIEKTGLTHGEGDLSGVSASQIGALLDQMERRKWAGALWIGQPGCGKTMLAHALAGEFGRPLLRVDLDRTKSSLVGESEHNVRQCLDTVWALAGPGAYWCGSSNSIRALPAAVVARFSDGRWYFDLLTDAEKRVCWAHYMAKFGVSGPAPNDDGWSGREIRNCCRTAYRLGCSLSEAASYVVPIAQSDPQTLRALREEANGHYLDASRPGVFRIQTALTETIDPLAFSEACAAKEPKEGR